MSQFGLYLVAWFCCMGCSKTCSVQKGPSAYEIIRYLDGIMLTGVNDSISLSNLTKTGYVQTAERPVDGIYRLPPGETIKLHCPAGSGDPVAQYSEWMLKGEVLFPANDTTDGRWSGPRLDSCSCRLKSATDPLFQNMSRMVNRTTGSDILILRDHSHMHAGEYNCIQYRNGKLVVLKRYLVSPKLTAREVFDPPMKNIWARPGETVSFQCAVRFHVLTGLRDRFIWRNDEFIVAAVGVETFKNAVRARGDFGATIQYRSNGTCNCHSTLVIHKVTRRHTGLYQCWFRVDDLFDEWIVQTAYLNVVD